MFFRFDLGPPHSRSNDGSLALVSCLFGGYKFASVLSMRRSSFDLELLGPAPSCCKPVTAINSAKYLNEKIFMAVL